MRSKNYPTLLIISELSIYVIEGFLICVGISLIKTFELPSEICVPGPNTTVIIRNTKHVIHWLWCGSGFSGWVHLLDLHWHLHITMLSFGPSLSTSGLSGFNCNNHALQS